VCDRARLRLFEAFGIELEYMLVDARSLDVAPVCDRVMAAEAGRETSDVEFDDVTWSNELALHVIEFKTSRPSPTLAGLAARFQDHVMRAGARAAALGARLMPAAMHPWMNPASETRLWPHECGPIYQAFERIFGCTGHGWSNLQSMHINLPFDGDDEFGRLHAAIRVVLPIIPALAASSPIVEGRATGGMDRRLEAYRGNCARVPEATGAVIPEPVFTMDEYHGRILRPLYAALAPLDLEGVLQEEFANARGAIARFERGSIEIRVIDVQECPAADLAIAAVVIETVRALVEERWSGGIVQRGLSVDALVSVFDACVRDADEAVVRDDALCRALGIRLAAPMRAADVWASIINRLRRERPDSLAEFDESLTRLMADGPLARRILRRTGSAPSRRDLDATYRALCDCLREGRML
jgi:carboxylate-amine ligase